MSQRLLYTQLLRRGDLIEFTRSVELWRLSDRLYAVISDVVWDVETGTELGPVTV